MSTARAISSFEKPEVGKVFVGKYLIVDKIGEGGFGIVFGAHNGPTNRGFPVAIKWLKPERAKNEAAVRSFVEEADIAGHIRSQHVVTVHDKSYDPPFVVMERLRGQNLREYFEAHLAKSHRPLTPAEVGPIILPVLRGVRAAHNTRLPTGTCIIHRDIKPENIFLSETEDGDAPNPTLVDFGIAKLAEPDEGVTVETSELVRGTPDYMSREQLFDRKHVGPWTDIHAIGVILYELLSGVRPYRVEGDETTLDVCFKVREGAFVPLDDRMPGLEPGLVAVVHKAMAADFHERYQDAASLERALQPYLRTGAESAVRIDSDSFSTLEVSGPDGAAGQPVRERDTPSSLAEPAVRPQAPRGSGIVPGLEVDRAQREVERQALRGVTEKGRSGSRKAKMFASLGLLVPLLVVGTWWGLRERPPPSTPPKLPVETAIEIDSLPSGAAIRIDGKPQKQRTPAKIVGLTEGKHTLDLQGIDGYQGWRTDVMLTLGEVARMGRVELQHEPPPVVDSPPEPETPPIPPISNHDREIQRLVSEASKAEDAAKLALEQADFALAESLLRKAYRAYVSADKRPEALRAAAATADAHRRLSKRLVVPPSVPAPSVPPAAKPDGDVAAANRLMDAGDQALIDGRVERAKEAYCDALKRDSANVRAKSQLRLLVYTCP